MLATLIRLLLKEIKRGSLKENAFARRLADKIIQTGNVPDEAILLSVLYKKDSPKDFNFNWKKKHPDRRIKSLFLKDIRQYSPSRNNEDGVDFYGLDFTIGGTVASSILQGPNGAGKTSLYSSLEYLYQGHSEIASAHGFDEDQLDNFFRSVGVSLSNVEIGAEFVTDEEIKNNRLLDYEIPAAFCSECDYFEITRKWKEIDHYIAYQVGYREMLQLHKGLKLMVELLKLSSDFKRYSGQAAEWRSKLKSESDASKKALIEQQILELEISKEAVKSDFDEVRGKRYSKEIEDFLKDNTKQDIDASRLQEVFETFSYIDKTWKDLLDKFLKSATPIFSGMMKGHLIEDSESFKIEIDEGEVKFSLSVTGNRNREDKTPIEYFNTFRLKLFCVAFKMSLFCCAKQLHDMNLPFVIDDIFDSSDFYHRSNIGSFIWHMLESHDEALPKKGKVAYPLQLLFFTQDNIIAENVYRGMSDYVFEKNRETEMYVKYGRLFRPCDARLDEGKAEPEKAEDSLPEHVSEVQYKGKSAKVVKLVDYFSEI